MATELPTRAGARRPNALLAALFVDDTSTWTVALVAVVPVLLAVAALFVPGRLVSREMTWDLLFLLEGAWHLHSGHVPYVDFHLVMGPVVFELTRLGFLLVGFAPQAVLVAEVLAVLPIFAAATFAVSRRLPLLPSVLFVVYVSLLILLPANIGDSVEAYSLAMLYNRWGWSALMTLCLILFVPPRSEGDCGWIDPLIGLGLLFFLFYLKITYALAGGVAVAFALVTPGHIRAHWRLWAAVLAVAGLDAVLPHNRAYLSDLWMFAQSGYIRADFSAHARLMLDSKDEYALMLASIALLIWLRLRGQAPASCAASATVVCALGVLVLSQNAQIGDIPLVAIPLLVIYQVLRQPHVLERSGAPSSSTAVVLPLAVLLAWPFLSVVSEAATFGGYYRLARRPWGMRTVTETNLRGLIVERSGEHVRYAVSQVTYVDTLLEASRFLAHLGGPLKIMVVDQTNPFPFMLGYPPPRGANLWLQRETPPRPAAEMFGDADVVLIPKFSTSPDATSSALEVYGDYLAQTFPEQEELPSWTVLSRAVR